MKYLILILFSFESTFSQNNTLIDTLILSDSLYNQKSSVYSFEKVLNGFGYNVAQNEVQDINDFVKIEKNLFKLKIKYPGGCGTSTAKLIYNGVEYSDKNGAKYYILKLLFVNNDDCAALKSKDLIFNISSISGHKIKFFGYDQFLN